MPRKYEFEGFTVQENILYIYTQELKEQLANTELRSIKDTAFRMRIIGKLRDNGVIIASSQKGYKIPSKQSELYDFINHDAKIVIPMLARLKKCRDLVKLCTANELDLLAHAEYDQLQEYFDDDFFDWERWEYINPFQRERLFIELYLTDFYSLKEFFAFPYPEEIFYDMLKKAGKESN